MKKRMEEELKKAEQELKDLDKEWDRLDSQGLPEVQRVITDKMENLRKEIEGLKYTINILK
jgi:predicted nuclease with TOPRIM domain